MFLRRIALAETQDGKCMDNIKNTFSGGIWQVSICEVPFQNQALFAKIGFCVIILLTIKNVKIHNINNTVIG